MEGQVTEMSQDTDAVVTNPVEEHHNASMEDCVKILEREGLCSVQPDGMGRRCLTCTLPSSRGLRCYKVPVIQRYYRRGETKPWMSITREMHFTVQWAKK